MNQSPKVLAALAVYDAALEEANASHAATLAKVGGYGYIESGGQATEAVFYSVVQPARALWDAKVSAAYAAYEAASAT
jgi:hypothetical protein